MPDQVLEQKVINEEYKIWKKNVPYLYDVLFSHVLEWPSLSIQWLSDVKRDEEAERTTQRLLLSTHTSRKENEYILIAKVDFLDMFDGSLDEDVNNEDMNFKIVQRIPVIDEVNRVRYNPFACNVLAARSDLPDIHVYDYTKHLLYATDPKPDMVLRGHKAGGFGISWNALNNGEIASCGEDGKVCVFDIGQEATVIQPTVTFEGHKAAANDCAFSPFERRSLASVGDDNMLIFWDLNTGKQEHILKNVQKSSILSFGFSPLNDTTLATCSEDGSINVWDKRNLGMPLHSLLWHTKEVLNVEWSPHAENILASSGMDRRVCIWDLSLIGTEIPEEHIAEGPSELVFVHGGHTGMVCDISWNPAEPLEIASVAEDNTLQIWQIPEIEKTNMIGSNDIISH